MKPVSGKTIKVAHIITGLDTGGAEMMLYKLLHALPKDEVESSVISLMEPGPIAARIEALGITVQSLGLKQGELPSIRKISKLISLMRDFKPTAVQGWMYHGNLAGLLASVIVRPKHLLWNVRQTIYEMANEKRVTRWLIKLGAFVSRWPDKIIYNSYVSAEQHEQLGFCRRSRVVVANGFDLTQFRPDQEAKQLVRRELGLPEDAILVGKISRYHPMKDHATLLRAASAVLKQRSDVYFLLAGRELTAENGDLHSLIDSLDLNGHILLLGERSDVPRLMATLDVSISSSAWGEGFPNAVGEAMACGVPCVVTDVGDSGNVVGEAGQVIPSGDPEAMASAIVALMELSPEERERIGAVARERIQNNFSLDVIAQRYMDLYR